MKKLALLLLTACAAHAATLPEAAKIDQLRKNIDSIVAEIETGARKA